MYNDKQKNNCYGNMIADGDYKLLLFTNTLFKKILSSATQKSYIRYYRLLAINKFKSVYFKSKRWLR